jgi:Family of unknown function (DUF6174)
MKNIISLCVMVVLVGSLSSCGLFDAFRCVSGYSRPDVGALRTQLTRQKEIWASKNLKTYAYSSQELGYVPTYFPLRVSVANGTVISVNAIQNPGQPKPDWTEPAEKSGFSMKRQFARFENSLNNVDVGACGTVSAEYDAVYGFPKLIESGRAEQGLADAFGGLRIFDFTVTP